MYFDFTQDAKDLAAGAREYLSGVSTPQAVRSVWDSDGPRDRSGWTSLAETGFVGVMIPETHGGLGMTDVEMVLLMEEAGRANLVEPLLDVGGVVAPTLSEAAPNSVAEEWLPKVAAGDAIITLLLDGQPVALDADVADAVMVEHDQALYLVPKDHFTASQAVSIDHARRVFRVDPTLNEATLITKDPDAVAKAHARAATFTAAWLNGLANQVLMMSVAYVKEREQFGRPVGSFQAVKHLLAETILETETARAAAWYAAYAVANDLADRDEAVSVAKSVANEAERLANTNALQAHGGIGFTWEHDLHLWLKRGKALEGLHGTTAMHRERIADVLFS